MENISLQPHTSKHFAFWVGRKQTSGWISNLLLIQAIKTLQNTTENTLNLTSLSSLFFMISVLAYAETLLIVFVSQPADSGESRPPAPAPTVLQMIRDNNISLSRILSSGEDLLRETGTERGVCVCVCVQPSRRCSCRSSPPWPHVNNRSERRCERIHLKQPWWGGSRGGERTSGKKRLRVRSDRMAISQSNSNRMRI